MTKMEQVMQVGEIEGNIHYYIEDYAYTYLKKQKGKEAAKYFLYGEMEETDQRKEICIYGISQKPKMEQTYFKEYYPLGFLKVKNEEMVWITLKGQEYTINGFYVFYAPNQAMQEYLVDHRDREKSERVEEKARRQLVGERLPIKETFISTGKIKRKKSRSEYKNEKFIIPVGGILIAGLVLMVLTTSNGQKKVAIFKQIIAQTMSEVNSTISDSDLIIEEKAADLETTILKQEEELPVVSQEIQTIQGEPQTEQEQPKEQSQLQEKNVPMGQASLDSSSAAEEIKENKEPAADQKTVYEEYVVKDGDTLAVICKNRYGSLDKMKEICTLNNIENADYISPGQKIYLP